MKDRDQGDLIGGLILTFLGSVFLLMNFGYLSWQLWGELWKFWPAILIVIGLGILAFKNKQEGLHGS